jgi:hypothetical protein
MKTSTILQTAILLTIIAFAASCRTSRDYPSDRRYPDPEARRYPDPESRRYPYPEDRRYPYPEQDRRVVVVPNDPNPGNLPPGQAKKVYGGKSARPYAPGQRKKQYDNYGRTPLIILRTPDIRIGRNNDGRYYHRNNDGWMYWQGYDNRFYLDEQYLGRVKYEDSEYKDWYNKGKDKANNSSKGQSNKGQGKGKSNGKGNNGNRGRGHH